MSQFNNSFSPIDIEIEFDGNIIDLDTGEETYLKIVSIIGQETKEVPKVGDYVLEKSKILPEPKIETKKSLGD